MDVPHVRQLCPEHSFEKKGSECNATKCAKVRPSTTCVFRLSLIDRLYSFTGEQYRSYLFAPGNQLRVMANPFITYHKYFKINLPPGGRSCPRWPRTALPDTGLLTCAWGCAQCRCFICDVEASRCQLWGSGAAQPAAALVAEQRALFVAHNSAGLYAARCRLCQSRWLVCNALHQPCADDTVAQNRTLPDCPAVLCTPSFSAMLHARGPCGSM